MERLTGASAKTYNIKDSTTVCQKCNDYVFNQFFVYNSDNKWTERKIYLLKIGSFSQFFRIVIFQNEVQDICKLFEKG